MGFFKKQNRALKNIQQAKEEENQKRAKAFIEEYKELSKKHKLDFGAEIRINANGLYPTIVIKELKETEENKEESKRV